MSFPEWGPPLGSIYIPVGNYKGALMTWGEAVKARRNCMRNLGNRDATYHEHEKRRAKESEWDKRVEDDKRKFIRDFRVRFDRISPGFSQCVAFLRNEVRISMWDVPRNSDELEQTLRRLVKSGQVVALIDSNWHSASGVSNWYAPQSWKSGGGGFASGPGSPASLAASLAAARHVMDRKLARGNSVFGSTAVARRFSGSSGGGGSGFDLLGAVEKVAGVMLGGVGPSSDKSGSLLKNFEDDSNGSSPLSDSLPFEYSKDSPFGDVVDISARGVSEADEADCFGRYENELDKCTFVRAMTQDNRAYAVCKELAFSNYQTCRGF